MSVKNDKNTLKGNQSRSRGRSKDRTGLIAKILGQAKALRRNDEGATAVEFGIIAIPFIILIVALLETALVHMTTLDLENAVKDASRQIRTGQVQVDSLSAAQFRDVLCDKTVLVKSCKSTDQLVVDIRSYEDFETISVDPSELYDEDGEFKGEEQYKPGSGLKVVVVRVYYRMGLLVPAPVIGLANAGPQTRMIDAISVFRNEPFS